MNNLESALYLNIRNIFVLAYQFVVTSSKMSFSLYLGPIYNSILITTLTNLKEL